jgi:hypothetical protein
MKICGRENSLVVDGCLTSLPVAVFKRQQSGMTNAVRKAVSLLILFL